MTFDQDSSVGVRTRLRPGTPDQVDRVLVISAIATWLAALGAGVAAIVALVDLAHAHSVTTGDAKATPWLLYAVIGVSAVVIVGAIPLLLRARQTASSAGVPKPASAGRDVPAVDGGARLQPFGAPVLRRHSTPPAGGRVGFPAAAVDQIWLRNTAAVATAMGTAATGIGVATYLMASGHDTAAWIVYGVAAVITVGMPAVPWFYLRQLHGLLETTSN